MELNEIINTRKFNFDKEQSNVLSEDSARYNAENQPVIDTTIIQINDTLTTVPEEEYEDDF